MGSSSDRRKTLSGSSASSEAHTKRYVSAFERKQQVESSSEIDLPAPAAHLKAIPGSAQEDPQKRVLKAVKTLSKKSQSFASDSDNELPAVPDPKAKISLLPSKKANTTNSGSSINSDVSLSGAVSESASQPSNSAEGSTSLSSASSSSENIQDSDSIAPEPHFPVVTLSDEQRALGIHTISSSSINDGGVVYSHTMLTALPSSSGSIPKVGGRHTLIHSSNEYKSASREKPVLKERPVRGKLLHITPKRAASQELQEPQVDYVTAAITLASILLFFVIMITLALAFLWPEHLPRLNLTLDKTYIILLIEVTIMLLMSSFQNNFSARFRQAIFAGGILTAAETIIVLYFS